MGTMPRPKPNSRGCYKRDMVTHGQVWWELQARGAADPKLAAQVSLYSDLIAAQVRTDVSSCAVTVSTHALNARIQAGLPLIAPEDFRADRAVFLQLCYEICAIVAMHREDLVTRIDEIRAWFDEGWASKVEWAALLREGHTSRGEEDRLDRFLLAFILNQALRPFLQTYARTLLPFVDETIWYRLNCPICGGLPDFAALAKPDGARRLLCSRCDAEWAFWRTGCPFCGSDDHTQQKYSISEDHVYRLSVCQACGRYLKTIDLREVADERLLPVERILTLPLDVTFLLMTNAITLPNIPCAESA